MQRQRDPYTLALSVMSPRNCALIFVLSASLLVSCSLTTYGDDACSSNGDCRAAFGFGATCSDDGLCSGGGVNARCTRTFPRDLFTRPQLYADSIVLGAILNETDPSDVAAENAIELAVKQVNDLAGVDGPEFAMVFCTNERDATIDIATEEEATAALGLYLARDLGVPAIIGPSTSSQSTSLYASVAPLGTLIISPSATSTVLTTIDADTGLFWRTCAPDSEQGAAIANDLEFRMVMRVAVIYEQGPYGTSLADVFTGAFSGTATQFPFALGNATLRDSQAMEVASRAAEFDEVLFISSNFADAEAFTRYAASTPGLTTKPIFLTDTAAGSPEFLEDPLAAPLFPRIRGSRPGLATGPVYDQFLAAYLTRFTMETREVIEKYQYVPGTYDAAWLTFVSAAWSLEQTGAVRGADMAEALTRVSATSPGAMSFELLPSDWAGLSAEIAARRDVDVAGASGNLDFDALTGETSRPVEIWRIDSTATPPVLVVARTVIP